MKKTAVLFLAILIGLIAVVAADTARSRLERRSFVKSFMSTPNIKAVESYLNHEGYRAATLETATLGEISIGGFDKSIFVQTDKIILHRINNIRVVCREMDNPESAFYFGAFNLIAYSNSRIPDAKIKNISDVLTHYITLSEKLERELFQDGGLNITSFDSNSHSGLNCKGSRI